MTLREAGSRAYELVHHGDGVGHDVGGEKTSPSIARLETRDERVDPTGGNVLDEYA